jgi:hypothetical protein
MSTWVYLSKNPCQTTQEENKEHQQSVRQNSHQKKQPCSRFCDLRLCTFSPQILGLLLIPTAPLLEHLLQIQEFMGTSKATFPRRLRLQTRDSTWAILVDILK